MAESRLDIVGDFGDLFPNLEKLGKSQEDLKNKTTELSGAMKDGFTQAVKPTREWIDVLTGAAQKTDDNIKKITELRSRVEDLRKAIDTNKGDAGLVSTLNKELKTTETELIKAGGAATKFNQNFPSGIKGSTESVKSFSGQIRELQKDLANAFSSGNQQRVDEITGKIAVLKDTQLKLNLQVQALDPNARFNAFSQVARGAAGGVEAVVGAMALFGSKSETVERVLIRIQAAMTFSRGLNELLQIGNAFNSFRAILSTTEAATKISNAATQDTSNVLEIAQQSAMDYNAAILAQKNTIEILDRVKKGDTQLTIVNTAAERENTAGVLVNAEAQTTSAAVTRGAAVSTNLLTVATKGFQAALAFLISPIGIAVAALGLLTFAAVEYYKSGIDLDKILKDLEKDQKILNDAFEISQEGLANEITLLDSKISLMKEEAKVRIEKAGGVSTAAGLAEKEKSDREILEAELDKTQRTISKNFDKVVLNNQLIKKGDEAIALAAEDLAISTAKRIQAQLSGGVGLLFAASQEELDKKSEQLNKLTVANNKLKAETEATKTQNLVLADQIKGKSAQSEAEIQADKNAANKKALEVQKQFHQQYIQAEKELHDALLDLSNKAGIAIASSLTGEARLEQERKNQQKIIDETEIGLLKKGQAEEDAAAKLQGRRARIFHLSEEQEAQFETIRLVNEKQFLDKITELRVKNSIEKINATESGLKKELDLFDANFATRAKTLKDQGVSDVQIEQIKEKEKLKVRTDFTLKQLDIENNLSKSIVDQMQINGISEANAERIRNEKKLEVDLEFAKQRLLLLESQRTLTRDPQLEASIEAAKGAIRKLGTDIKAAQKDITDNAEPFSLAKLFGIAPGKDSDDFNKAASDFLSSMADIGNELLAGSMARADAEIENNQKVIDDYNRRVDEITALIEKEDERNKKGLANNLDARRKELLQLKQERDKSIAEEKRLQEEKRKLAKEQALINAASITSGLIVSTVNVIEDATKKGGLIGVILGLAGAAALVSGFFAIRNSIQSAEKQSLEYGGLVDGKSHSEGGGNKYVSQDGNKILYTERGEYFTNKEKTKKNLNLLNAINFDRRESVDFDEVFPFLKKSGIPLRRDIAKPISDKQVEYNNYVYSGSVMATNDLKDEVKDMKTTLHKEVKKINERLEQQPTYHTSQNGDLVKTETRGNVIYETIYKK